MTMSTTAPAACPECGATLEPAEHGTLYRRCPAPRCGVIATLDYDTTVNPDTAPRSAGVRFTTEGLAGAPDLAGNWRVVDWRNDDELELVRVDAGLEGNGWLIAPAHMLELAPRHPVSGCTVGTLPLHESTLAEAIRTGQGVDLAEHALATAGEWVLEVLTGKAAAR